MRKAKHLLRRTTFSFNKTTIESFATKTPQEALIALTQNIPDTLSIPYDPLPVSAPGGYWTNQTINPSTIPGQARKRQYVSGWWWYNAHSKPSIKYMMSFFLHTTFTIAKSKQAGTSTHFYDHIKLLNQFATGNIKDLAKKMTVDNCMLEYLNNTDNRNTNPNENYAREFLELFTIGKEPQIANGDYTNYTEYDVQQAARVLSGFQYDQYRLHIDSDTNLPRGKATVSRHDTGNKTFSPAFGNETITGQNTASGMYDELGAFVDMIFNQSETAKAYCRKLYKFFVKTTWDTSVEMDIIEPLSSILISNNYDLEPVIKALLESQHFYDEDDTDNTDNVIGSIIKSPLHLLSEVCNLFELTVPDPINNPLHYYRNFFSIFINNSYLYSAGLPFFDPESVAGYPAYFQTPDLDKNWFVSNTVLAKHRLITSLIAGRDKIATNHGLYTKLNLVAFIQEKLDNPDDPTQIVNDLAELMYPEAMSITRLAEFKAVLLNNNTENYWTIEWQKYLNNNNPNTLNNRLNGLVSLMINVPEFQLM